MCLATAITDITNDYRIHTTCSIYKVVTGTTTPIVLECVSCPVSPNSEMATAWISDTLSVKVCMTDGNTQGERCAIYQKKSTYDFATTVFSFLCKTCNAGYNVAILETNPLIGMCTSFELIDNCKEYFSVTTSVATANALTFLSCFACSSSFTLPFCELTAFKTITLSTQVLTVGVNDGIVPFCSTYDGAIV